MQRLPIQSYDTVQRERKPERERERKRERDSNPNKRVICLATSKGPKYGESGDVSISNHFGRVMMAAARNAMLNHR
jgi:hypothetical protein